MIRLEEAKIHWNYYLAIEEDLARISRYIEFSKKNFNTYSIELARILLSACSEIDVVMKQICSILEQNKRKDDINKYRVIIKKHKPELIGERIYIDKYAIHVNPWSGWEGEDNPIWWKAYNDVKHQRGDHFADANLKNAINAVGALLIVVTYYYQLLISQEKGDNIHFRLVNQDLKGNSLFIRMNNEYYYGHLLI